MDSLSSSSIPSMLIQARASLNSRLSEFEPLVLLLAPLLTLFLAQIIGSVFGSLHDKGCKACLVGFVMGFLKMIPGVQSYIDAEKQKVVDQLQSGSNSKKKNRTEVLPVKGLGVEVIEKMENEKRNDAIWQGKCSGTVYVCDT